MPTYNVRLGCLPFQKWTIPGIFLVYFRPFQNVMTNIVFNWKINGKGVDSSLRFEPEPQTDWMVGEDHRAMVAPPWLFKLLRTTLLKYANKSQSDKLFQKQICQSKNCRFWLTNPSQLLAWLCYSKKL